MNAITMAANIAGMVVSFNGANDFAFSMDRRPLQHGPKAPSQIAGLALKNKSCRVHVAGTSWDGPESPGTQ
jgi:hypothetical protein